MAEADSIVIPRRVKDLTGKRFGRWTVLAFAGQYAQALRAYWMCRCECGTTKAVCGANLANGHSISCGCFKREQVSASSTTHGKTKTPEYNTWAHILSRCYDHSNTSFDGYGGRGIVVCERWRVSFEAFLADMGHRPSTKHSVERKDNNGNYEPGNCIWATRKEQQRNTRQNVMLTLNGKTQCVAAWCEELGIRHGTLLSRIRRGWPVDRALREPVDYSRRNSLAAPSL